MLEIEKKFCLFANCISVRGIERAIIYDLQNNFFKFVPNSLINIIKVAKTKPIQEIIEQYNLKEDQEVIKKYIEFLIDFNLGMFFSKEEINNFPELNLNWYFPSQISNAIIDYDNNSVYDLKKLMKQFNEINCFHIQFRFLENPEKYYIDKLINLINDSSIRNIEILINFDFFKNKEDVYNLIDNNNKISIIKCFNAPAEERIEREIPQKVIFFHKDNILKCDECGKVSMEYFALNLNHFTESQLHNTCLNRKICIDADGEIKNCPSMKRSFGNIKDTTLKEAIEKPGFKELWFICKDKIDVCKDCEFRHMCTDCRAFIKDPDNIYSQPAKCPYNPYIAKWQGEEGYVSVEECGTYTKEKGFVVNKRKVNKLNKQIWGE